MNLLFRKLYLYMLMVLVISLLLTGLVTAMIFNTRHEGLVRNVIRNQVVFVGRELAKTQRRAPNSLPERMQELGDDLGWNIALWEQGQLLHSTLSKPPLPPQDLSERLQKENYVLSWDFPGRPQVWISQSFPRMGFRLRNRVLWLQPRLSQLSRPAGAPLLAFVLILLILGLLLLPLTRFLLKPYRKLQTAIQALAQGDFSQKLESQQMREFEPLVSSFNHMSSQLAEMLSQKQRLIADVSHELRSPLTRLRMLLEILHQQAPEQADLLEKGIAETEELDHIIQDLLDISRLELDQLPLNKSRQDLRSLVFESLERHEPLLEQKGLRIEPEMPASAVMVEVDRERLNQVFNNLFSNLSKYVPDPSSVSLQIEVQAGQALFHLRDRGPGLAAADLEKIFEPFYRPDTSRSRRTGGTGLGLAISRRIARAHGGDLRASLPQDGGLALHLSLPLAAA